MTDNNHPITPPPELVQQWLENYFGPGFNVTVADASSFIATQTSQWIHEQRGASNEAELQKARDEELEACCEWLLNSAVDGAKTPEPYIAAGPEAFINALRAARRPKPKSLAEEGYDALDTYIYGNPDSGDKERTYNALRHALERLQELEGQAND